MLKSIAEAAAREKNWLGGEKVNVNWSHKVAIANHSLHVSFKSLCFDNDKNVGPSVAV